VQRLIITVAACLAAAVSFAGSAEPAAVSTIKVDIPEVVEAGKVSPVDGITTSGQPDVAALSVFADSGYVAIIDLRGPAEDRGFDQKYAVEEFGMSYVTLPIEGGGAITFDNAKKLDEILAEYDGPVLVHCKSGNRAGALLALRASLNGADDEAALAFGKEAGITAPGLEQIVREQLEKDPD
jgi:uncharacterized protein (TIGR01244 family)